MKKLSRNKKDLENKIIQAENKKQKAVAFYNLGLFHDNNAREKEAIPNYLKALKLGLDQELKSQCLVWLASSLSKTGKPKEALKRIKESQKIADKKLQKFLVGLEKRIWKSLKKSRN